ncbi:MAG TPA: twin-arginine translocation signal domain-containing protein [Candidatus Dormibacteraeota bacterium]|nr:twin-arginine translocation signal domain-containing protein [Candidatus Dormibacteraeota bacterium]
MQRRSFLKAGGAITLAAGLRTNSLLAHVPPHNFDKYDFGAGPPVADRLYQGPFSTDDYPSWSVVMALTASRDVVPNYGMGLITYVCDEVGPPKKDGESLAQSIENVVKLPLGSKLYLRVNWKDVQQRAGRLDFCEHWKLTFELARKYQKRIGFRVMMSNPDIPDSPLPEFLRDKIPMVKLGDWLGRTRYEPRYDDPAFQAAFHELVDLLADSYDGHPDVEYVDTFMYGFWGEGHTWPFEKNPFPDAVTAENTFVSMFQHQLERWKKTPMATNTQPDFSKVGNSELLDRTVRSCNWLRTDTIFIENEQIEELSNRPPWTGVTVEVGMSDGSPKSLKLDEGVTYTDNVVQHVRDVGACYFSLWNWHRIQADRVLNYYHQFPEAIDGLARQIGYRVRPSWVWTYEEGGYPGLIVGFVNDGIAAVPGVLRVSVTGADGRFLAGGCLDAGYPLQGKVRQAKFALPKGTKWKGLRLKAEIEVKGQRYPVRWACRQKLNEDGSLTLRQTVGLGQEDETGGVPRGPE